MNALLGSPLSPIQQVQAALEAEGIVAGHHADNVAPSALGGLVLVRSLAPLDLVCLPVPDALRIVLAHPEQQLRTAEGRAALPTSIPIATALHQAAQVAAIVAACLQGDLPLLGRSIDDQIAEPARSRLLPGFAAAKAAALDAGALGCSISGSGPTAFALVQDEATGERVAAAMISAYGQAGVVARARVARPNVNGVRIL
jgi:homoserine kinase